MGYLRLNIDRLAGSEHGRMQVSGHHFLTGCLRSYLL